MKNSLFLYWALAVALAFAGPAHAVTIESFEGSTFKATATGLMGENAGMHFAHHPAAKQDVDHDEKTLVASVVTEFNPFAPAVRPSGISSTEARWFSFDFYSGDSLLNPKNAKGDRFSKAAVDKAVDPSTGTHPFNDQARSGFGKMLYQEGRLKWTGIDSVLGLGTQIMQSFVTDKGEKRMELASFQGSHTVNPVASLVADPANMLLLGAGLLGFAGLRRRPGM